MSELDIIIEKYFPTKALQEEIAKCLIKILKENCLVGYPTDKFIEEVISEMEKRKSEWKISVNDFIR